MSVATIPRPVRSTNGNSASKTTRAPVWVACGFKAAKIKWGWLNPRSPTYQKDKVQYVRQSRWIVQQPDLRWAGFCVSLLAYEQPDGSARKLLYRFYQDFDAETDLESARRETVKAHDGLISMGVHPRIRFSGSKGFGLQSMAAEFNDRGWMQDGHLVGRHLHHLLVDELDLDPGVIDDTLWATRKPGG